MSSSRMISEWLQAASHKLRSAGISTARLDCLVLLEDATGKDRSSLLAHQELLLSAKLIKKLNGQIHRRASHIPLAYIRHKSEFYKRSYYIDAHVLEPRPESETMIELLKQTLLDHGASIIDVGTGSGALAITAKLEIPVAKVFAVDIDPACIKIARRNARLHHTDIHFHTGDLLSPLPDYIIAESILLCNLPYVPDSFRINPAAMAEPRLAIFGGQDGLDIYRKLFMQVYHHRVSPKYVLTEAMPPQHEDLIDIATQSGYILDRSLDFIQVFRKDSARSASSHYS